MYNLDYIHTLDWNQSIYRHIRELVIRMGMFLRKRGAQIHYYGFATTSAVRQVARETYEET